MVVSPKWCNTPHAELSLPQAVCVDGRLNRRFQVDSNGKMIYAGEAAGYMLHFPDRRCAYFARDTTVFSDMALIRTLYELELAFLPIGDVFTMSPKEARLACELVKPKKVIPMHWHVPALDGYAPAVGGTNEGID